ncbi:MAG TPA: hypothetical protein VI757_10175 [Bacteroidia bacterium]|nr:hypothetical protein [Bacteroidia bacterium]
MQQSGTLAQKVRFFFFSLKQYLFYVVIIGTAGKSPPSDQASSAAL